MSTNETPRTDAASFPDFERGGDVVLAEFAREIERELAAERDLADRLASVMFGCPARAMLDAYEAWEQARGK